MVRKGFVMPVRQFGCLGVAFMAFGLVLQVSTDQALAQDRRQECSSRYKAAKAEGSLGGLTWPQFFSRCVAELKAAAPAEPQPAAAVPEPVNPLKPAAEEPAPAAAVAPAPAQPTAPPVEAVTAAPPVAPETVIPPTPEPVAPAATVVPPAPAAAAPAVKEAAPAPREPVFPTAIAPAYAKLKPGAARQKTCLDQYNANKATDSNGGLKWTQKGGGYLAKCLAHLQGAS